MTPPSTTDSGTGSRVSGSRSRRLLMICGALSIGGGLSRRSARTCLTGSAIVTVAIAVYVFLNPPRGIPPLVVARPVLTGLAVGFFAWRLARKGAREAGSARPALLALTVVYCLHNLAFAWRGSIYPPSGYSAWSATIGILLQFGLTIVFSYNAIERADEASREAREADRRLRSLLESVGMAGLIVDRTGRVEFCNRWLEQALAQPA